jgi:hypothetical protein
MLLLLLLLLQLLSGSARWHYVAGVLATVLLHHAFTHTGHLCNYYSAACRTAGTPATRHWAILGRSCCWLNWKTSPWCVRNVATSWLPTVRAAAARFAAKVGEDRVVVGGGGQLCQIDCDALPEESDSIALRAGRGRSAANVRGSLHSSKRGVEEPLPTRSEQLQPDLSDNFSLLPLRCSPARPPTRFGRLSGSRTRRTSSRTSPTSRPTASPICNVRVSSNARRWCCWTTSCPLWRRQARRSTTRLRRTTFSSCSRSARRCKPLSATASRPTPRYGGVLAAPSCPLAHERENVEIVAGCGLPCRCVSSRVRWLAWSACCGSRVRCAGLQCS